MIQSEKIDGLLAGLVEVQGELPTMPKSSQAYGYKYADLDTITQAIKPILSKHGIGYMQSVGGDAGSITLTTRIFNRTGEYIEDTAALPSINSAKNNAAQTLGMSITYMRRYALCAMLGITSDEDVDANMNARPPEQKPEQKKIQLKGGDSTEAEKTRILQLYNAKYANGKPVFSKEEKAMYSRSRQTERTASELIAFVEHALRNRRADAPELAQAQTEKPADPEQDIY